MGPGGYCYTGFKISQPGGNTLLVLASGHEDSGDKTVSEVWLIRCPYDGVTVSMNKIYEYRGAGTTMRLLSGTYTEGGGHILVLNSGGLSADLTIIGTNV